MTFWSSQTLEANLSKLIPSAHRPEVDCNAVTLTVGNNCYVTPRWSAANHASQTLRVLADGETFTIPPGQFGFLETAETIMLSDSVMGFISFKATFKMQGLVNVSGFHVDPGWKGSLRFALFNAGPNPIHLKQGMQLFLLWIANLDEPSQQHRATPSSPDDFIRIVNGISGPVNSGYDLSDRVAGLEVAQAATKEQVSMIKGLGLGLVIGVVLLVLGFILDGRATAPRSVAVHKEKIDDEAASLPAPLGVSESPPPSAQE